MAEAEKAKGLKEAAEDMGLKEADDTPSDSQQGAAESTSDDGWNERTAQYFEFTKAGQSLIGKLAQKETVHFDGREVGRFTVENDNGRVAFLGGAQLDTQLADVALGTLVKVQYEGTAKTRSGFQAKMFRVFTRES